jgi:hypothetical protein
MGAERGSRIEGALAAALIALDPVFFNQGIQPMSDVPATMWMLLAAWMSIGMHPRPLVSGVAAGMAVFTRPALLVAAAVLGISLAIRLGRRPLGWWLAGSGAFVLAHAAVQYVSFGNPASSGYGTAEHLFQISRAPDNLANYAHWLIVVYGALVFTVAAPFVVRAAWAWTAAALAAAVAAPYLFYVTFDDWEVTRFLLPGSALVLIAGASAIVSLLARVMPSRWIAAAALAVALAVGARSYAFLVGHGVHRLARAESKYPMLAGWISEHAPPDAVVVSSLHSGSIRFYTGRTILRWDEIPADRLTETIGAVRRMGRVCYLALDGPEEESLFRARFGARLDELTFIPAARLRGLNIVTIERGR